MKEYDVDLQFVDKLLCTAIDNDMYVDIWEGSLLDNAIIQDAKALKIKGLRRAKHIIIRERYVNSWTSKNVLILTDSDKKAQAFIDEMEAIELEYAN